MSPAAFNRLVGADITRLMRAPSLRQYVVTVNYTDDLLILATSARAAIDQVLDLHLGDIRVLNCDDLEICPSLGINP